MASVPPGSAQNQNPNEDRGFNSLLKEYILERDPGYRSLAELREKVLWLIQNINLSLIIIIRVGKIQQAMNSSNGNANEPIILRHIPRKHGDFTI